MAKRRKGDKSTGESSSTRPPHPTRISLPRASKSNKPNYKVDVDDEDDALAMCETSGSTSRARQKRPQLSPDDVDLLSIGTGSLACGFRLIERDEIIAQHAARTSTALRTVLSWLIDMGIVYEFEKVEHNGALRGLLVGRGWIVRGGIICTSCKVCFTVSEFGAHRGDDRLTTNNLVLPTRHTTLLTRQLEAWAMLTANPSYSGYNTIRNEQDSSDPSDDSCIVCGDGGNLICCSVCPSTYHQSCLNLQDTPPDDWKCHNCRCKFCENVADEGRMLFTCAQCQKKYHLECFGGEDLMSFDSNVYRTQFCDNACCKIHLMLHEMLGVKKQIDKDVSWTFIKRIGEDYVGYFDDLYAITMSNLKVAVASRIMEECFEPIIDRFTRINMIRNVVFNSGSNFPRIDFTGFYTAILESKDEIISVASVRVHGPKLAEIPFIATSLSWRGKGMCHALLRSIETALRDVGVEHIYVPSTSAMVKKWTTSYDFENLSNDVRKEVINTNCLMFLSSTRLQKNIQRHRFSKFLPDLNQVPPMD